MDSDSSKQALGGERRAMSLSAERRSEIAKNGAEARWSKHLPVATHDGIIELADGKIRIACAVLDSTKRVLTQETFLVAIGRAGKAKGGTGSRALANQVDALPPFIAAENLKQLIDNDLRESTTPIVYRTTGGVRAYGYDAVLLPKVCEVYLKARDNGLLLRNQEHIAKQCEILMRGLARVGIIALIDEATGYQADRARLALAEILEKFISAELRRWVKTFPDGYFRELCRLKGVNFRADMKLPPYFGHLTKDLVYKRLAPGVLRELQELNPRNESGRRRHRHHQWLSGDVGHPKLLEHLGLLIGVMKLSDTFEDFKTKIDRIAPVYGNWPLLEDAGVVE
jgi:hypothetical protein